MVTASAAYEALIDSLVKINYAFICPSPETQGRVVKKRTSDASTAEAKTAQDVFGWNLACTRNTLQKIIPDSTIEELRKAEILVSTDNDELRSTVRVSNFYLPHYTKNHDEGAPLYYVHSSFPASSDSVFFGPDTYLFVKFLQDSIQHIPGPPKSVVDVCCGSGAGAIHMARTYPQANVCGLDLNPRALALGGVNSQLANVKITFDESNLYAAAPDSLKSDGIDLIVSNPPYIASSTSGEDLPIYADGGAEFGLGISLRIVEEGVKLLSSNGIILLYTGVAIPTADPAHDEFLERLKKVQGAELVEYTIIHPDMWAEEIGQGPYAEVGRIQVVGAVIRRTL